MKKVTIKNFEKVLQNINKLFNKEQKNQKKVWVESFNNMLDDLKNEDFFGTEGQTDPRGDQRD